MDELLDLLACIGMAFELPGLASHSIREPSVRFAFLRYDPSWTGWNVEKLLLHYGIRCFGRGFDKTTLWLHVPKHLANWAEYVMRRHGVPLATVYNPANTNVSITPIPSWDRPLAPKGILNKIMELLG